MDINRLIEQYTTLSWENRLEMFYHDFKGARVLVTTSLGNTSPVLLKLIKDANPNQEVTFIDTGYHFKETIAFKEQVEKKVGTNIRVVAPPSTHHLPTKKNMLWNIDPDFCCLVNKVLPVKRLLEEHDVWISGLQAYQNANRRNKKMFEQKEILKFYPILDMTEQETSVFIKKHHLPTHPLAASGYGSIGCFHCTQQSEGRKGRWSKFNKTECGLHV